MKISTKMNLGNKCKSTREGRSAPPVGQVHSSAMTRTSTHAGFNVQLPSFLISLLEELGRHQFCDLDRQNSLYQVIYSKYWRSSHSPSGGGGEQDQQRSGHQKEDRRLSPWQRPEPTAGQKLPRSLCVTSSCQKVTPQLVVGVVATGGKLQGVDVVKHESLYVCYEL